MAVKHFKSERDKRPPLEFEIEYEQLIGEEWIEQTDKFHARPSVPGALLLRIAAAMSKDVGVQSAELVSLLNRAITKEDKPAFTRLIEDDDIAVQIETLADVLEWLAEEYSERPTQRA